MRKTCFQGAGRLGGNGVRSPNKKEDLKWSKYRRTGSEQTAGKKDSYGHIQDVARAWLTALHPGNALQTY